MAEAFRAALLADYASGAVDNYISGVTLVLIVYEYIITFDAEVQLFWTKKISVSIVLFWINRYLLLLYQLSQLRRDWVFTDASVYGFTAPLWYKCTFYYDSSQAVILLCYIPWGAFSALRVFALVKRHKAIAAATVFLLSMGPVITNFATYNWSAVIDSSGNCRGEIDLSPALALRRMVFKFLGNNSLLLILLPVTIISRLSLVAADLMVIIMTWSPTYDRAMAVRAALGKGRTTLSFIVFRDGLIYFITMVIMNVLHIVVTSCSIAIVMGADHTSEITKFTEVFTAILISRSMMNLQETALRQGATKSEYESMLCERDLSSLHFDKLVGSFGKPVYPNICEAELEDEEEPAHESV